MPALKLGAQNFYESKLMAEIYAQALEASGFKIDRQYGGTRDVTKPALEAGQIDMIPDYLGSLLGKYDKAAPSGDAAGNAKKLADILKAKNITVLAYTPAQDQNGFVVRKDTATQFNLAKMSDLAAVQDKLKWGLPPECKTNPLCSGALTDKYGITFPPKQLTPLAACDSPIAQALQAKAIDVAELCTTQPAIAQFGFVLLEDDKASQPAENIAPLVREDYLAKVDAAKFTKILNDVSAKMTTDSLTKLGVEVAVNQKDVKDVAKGWLKDNGLGH